MRRGILLETIVFTSRDQAEIDDDWISSMIAVYERFPKPHMPETTIGETTSIKPTRVIRSVLVFALVGTALYAGVAVSSNYDAVVSALLSFPLTHLIVVILLVFWGWFIRAIRFHYYLKKCGERVPLSYALCSFLAGFALTGTPGKVGEAVKGVFLREDYKVPVSRTLGILVIERLMDLWGVLFLGSFSFLMFSGWVSLFLICAGIVLGTGIFLCVERLYRPVLEKLGKFSILSWIAQKLLETLITGKELLTVRIFLVGFALSVVAWGMESVCMYIILAGLGLPGSLLEANFVYCFSTIVGAVSMLPGGIGGAEAGMFGLLSFLGVSYAEAVPAVILIRVCTLWIAVVVGCIFMWYFLLRTSSAEKR